MKNLIVAAVVFTMSYGYQTHSDYIYWSSRSVMHQQDYLQKPHFITALYYKVKI